MAKQARSLGGQVVAVTGGARGIGRATAAALIAQGAKVAIGDIDRPLVERTAQELGHGTLGLPLDVCDRASFSAFLDKAESELGPLEVLINNAGIMPVGPFLAERDAIAAKMIDINLNGVLFGCKLGLERFVPRGRGHIVNVSSAAGKGGFPGLATYCATKHAVVGLSEALRTEFAASGVGFTLVMPVGVNTDLYSGIEPPRGFKIPEPEDVAEAIVEAIRTNRFEVFIPASTGRLYRMQALMPRRVSDAFGRLLGTDKLLMNPDQVARAAYDERIQASLAAAPTADDAPSAAPDLERAKQKV